jgi:phage terminase Nu1 subunit (DNA packaging protein)
MSAQVTRAQLAVILDLTPQRISQLTGSKLLERIDPDGTYDLVQSTVSYIRHLRKTSAPAKLADAKTRHMRARADLAEMDREERRGELVLAKEAQAGWVAILHRIKQRLRSIPRKLAQRVVMISDPSKAEKALATEINQALADCARKELVATVANPGDETDS